ncbi:beta-1,4-N-acetylgalactosaminyltransferase bre-4 isoform X2 [Chironomus tepperi]|uniref:beta-1,4-N-acetylgalactosaminyltransferase bre-4 isoform X2 n=1 Tax=Chironomus tepperi TaxID=113505 RepID=UPI00391F1CD6
MAIHLSRTLAIKAALLAGLLLIFFNLIGLRFEIKFDRSPINLSHTSIPLQWPKRTHTNHHNLQHHAHSIISTTTRQTPINESIYSSHNASKVTNTTNLNLPDRSTNDTSTSNVIINSNDSVFSETGDIKLKNSHKSGKNVEIVSHSSKISDKVNGTVLNNDVGSSVSVLPMVVNHDVNQHKTIKQLHNVKIKKSKYQDFDQSLVPDEGIFDSIMKVLGLNNKCPLTPPDLVGPIEVDSSPDNLENVEKSLSSKVEAGGRYKPSECKARDRVAIIIPYRDRKQHLPILLKNLHPFLMKQQIDYGIFIIEQSSDGNFNRAKLFNVGFVEALKLYEWDCFIFHDVDLLPMDDRNLYTCPDQPRHMSVAIDTFDFKLPYSSIFGGVSSMTTKQFKAINGFSNSFWGWGGEDDDASRRLKHAGYHIARYPVNIARYTMLSHKKEKANPKRYEKLVTGANRFNTDGLNSLKYKILEFGAKPLYTWILVEITPENR